MELIFTFDFEDAGKLVFTANYHVTNNKPHLKDEGGAES